MPPALYGYTYIRQNNPYCEVVEEITFSNTAADCTISFLYL